MSKSVIIIGGGLSGLACANRLYAMGALPSILEASDAPGGRVRTDEVDGFLLDRGFQVYLSAYPEAGRLLDLEALDLKQFRPGALVWKDEKFHRVMDVFRCPLAAPVSVLAPIGSFWDKLRIAKLRAFLLRNELEKDQTTEDFLREFGFSDRMIDDFFRAFYGGIFLERDLRTSARMFAFTFKMFTEGYATLPAKGMQQIPRQLAARLPAGGIHTNAAVSSVDRNSVVLQSGEKLNADVVVVATDVEVAGRLLPGFDMLPKRWRPVTGLYYSAPVSPLKEAIIALNSGNGVVNNVCVLSDVSSDYAPVGQSLISVTALAEQANEDTVKSELRAWFGGQVDRWRHLRTYNIRKALPEQLPTETGESYRRHDGVFVCGDHCSSASIEGAIVSGKTTAEAVLTG